MIAGDDRARAGTSPDEVLAAADSSGAVDPMPLVSVAAKCDARRVRVTLVMMVLAAGCAKTAVTPTPEHGVADVVTGDVPVAAFVIALDGETIVAPVDASIAPVRAIGIWVLDDAARPPVVSFHPAAPEGFPDCACVEEATACTGPIEVRPGSTPVCDCTEPDPPPYEGGYDPEDPDAEEAGCESSDVYPVSLVGGTLYLFSDDHDECNGRNIYDISSVEIEMVDDAVGMPAALRPADQCDTNGPGGEPPGWPLPSSACEPDEYRDAEACRPCREMSAEASAMMLHHGELVTVEDEVETVGGGPRRWSSVPLGTASCPSAADTCGEATHFAELDEADDYWVANDGVHALRLDGDALNVVDAHGASPRGTTGNAAVLGVRFHADARLLIATMTTRAPHSRESSQCRNDADCAAAHRGCNLRCNAGECVTRQVAELAAADVDFVDKRGGRDWGTRCIAHLRDGRLTNAQAACEAGLALATKPAIRGALLYNLGLVAIEGGDVALARTHFRESLTARPGNAVVQRALEQLPPE